MPGYIDGLKDRLDLFGLGPAAERARRARMTPLSRAIEDVAGVTKVGTRLIIGASVTLAPWAIGVWCIASWVAGKRL